MLRYVLKLSLIATLLAAWTPVKLSGQTTAASNRLLLDNGHVPHPLVAGLPGLTEPIEQVTLSAPLSDVLAQILVGESDEVERGDALATLDTRAPFAELRLAEAVAQRTAALQRTRQQLQVATQQLNRIRQLQAKRSATDAQLDQAVAAQASLQATLAEFEERHAEAQIQVDVVRAAVHLRTIRAPFAGRVIRILARVGETIETAQPILSLANLNHLRVDLQLPIAYFDQVQIGQTYALWAGAPVNHVVRSKLTTKEPLLQASTGTFRCTFELDNTTDGYPAGFPVRLIDPSHNVSGVRRHADEHAANSVRHAVARPSLSVR